MTENSFVVEVTFKWGVGEFPSNGQEWEILLGLISLTYVYKKYEVKITVQE